MLWILGRGPGLLSGLRGWPVGTLKIKQAQMDAGLQEMLAVQLSFRPSKADPGWHKMIVGVGLGLAGTV